MARADDRFLPLPCDGFGGLSEYRAFRQTHAALLAARTAHDRSYATSRASVEVEGTCGLCLRPATFRAVTDRGELTPAGRVPAWRNQLRCDCDGALRAHQRAVLQYVLGTIGVQPWYRVRLLGDDGGVAAVLRGVVADVTAETPATLRPRELLISIETLPDAAAIDGALHDAAANLVPGGHYVFTCAFDPDRPFSASADHRAEPHRIGWDVLTRLRAAGFRAASALQYWSEEFGYLGAANFIFDAVR